ncbi:MAG: ATP-binding protein [Candidatus Omnitrophica bacterium]|nr:ATP-binding protein [Candidatus Omnitrophota bacterium]
MSEPNIHSKVISSIVTALNKSALYPVTHPVVKESLKKAHEIISEALQANNELTFSISAENKVLVEGEPVVSEATMLLEEFISQFKKLQAESITFSEGLTAEELDVFFMVLKQRQEDIENQGGIVKILGDKGSTHIKVNLFSFVKVEKDKEILAVEKGDVRVVSIEDRILELKDKITEEQLMEILDKEIEKAHKESVTAEARAKINIVKTLEKLPAQLKKADLRLEKKQLEGLKKTIETKVDDTIEQILFEAAVEEFTKNKALTSVLKAIIKKLLSRLKDKDAIISKLKGSKFELSPEDIDNLAGLVEKELDSLIESETVKVSRQEYERLLRENETLKKSARQVSDEKERIDNIIHSMAEGLVVVDSEGRIQLMNPAAEKLLNIKKDDAIGASLKENIKDEHLLTFSKDFKKDSQGNITKEIELFSPDESTKRVLRTSSARIEDEDGSTVGMVTVLNDITRQKELENLKSDFVSHVSHELRTPLAVIQQSLSILNGELGGNLSADQKRFFATAQNNLERLRNLINDLLDMASIEAGKLKLKPAPFDINEVVKGTVEFMNKWAQAKNITLEAKLLPSKSEILIDKDRITQVITNLIGNAVKFTPENGRISVCLTEKPADETYLSGSVEISVIDTGVGMGKEDIEKIFNKFQQGKSAQDASLRGTGLGLSIAREIVQMHKGKIWVESEVGKGSKFTFLLPKNRDGS